MSICGYVIDDDNHEVTAKMPEGRVKGLVSRVSYCGAMDGSAGDPEPLIPMEEWPDRIADLDRTGGWAHDRWKDSPIGVGDQDGYSWCHAWAYAWHYMIQRAIQGLPYIEMSASSIGGPVTNYNKDRGAYILDDLEQGVKVGLASTEFVPMRDYHKSSRKPGADDNSALHKATEYVDLGQRGFQRQGSKLLLGKSTSDGFDWWGHAIPAVRLRYLNNGRKATDHLSYDKLILNQWGTGFGDNGLAWLSGTKKIADESYVVEVGTAGEK